MPMNNWSFRRNGCGKHPKDDSLTSSSTLSLDQELLKIKGTKDKRPFNSLDGSILSLAQTSPILSALALPPAVPPKTLGDPRGFNSVVAHENICQQQQQPVALSREVTETPKLRRVSSGVVLKSDIVVDLGTPAPSSAATSVQSVPTMPPSLPAAMMPLDAPSRPPPVPVRRPETKPLAPPDTALVSAAFRIPVPSTTPHDSIQSEANSSSIGSSEGSPIFIHANPTHSSKSLSLRTTQPIQSNAAPPPNAPTKPHQPLTPSITSDSSHSPASDSPLSLPGATMDVLSTFAAGKHTSESPQQQQQQQQHQPSQQQQQHQHQQGEGKSQTSSDGSRTHPPPPCSPLPPVPPLPTASSPMRVPVKRNTSQLPCSFMTDPATLLRRLFNNPLYSDMDISVDDATFHVHRGVLAEHCGYFREFFTNARGQEPTTNVRHLDCSYAPIKFGRGRPFSIAQVDSDDDSIRHTVSPPQVLPRLIMRRDRSALHLGGGGRDVLGSEDDEDELCFADVEDASSTGHGHGSIGPSRTASHQKHQHHSNPLRDGNKYLRPSADAPPPSSLKVDPLKANLQSPTPPKSNHSPTSITPDEEDGLYGSFSTAFIAADRRSVGYTAHHFACFLQILYGLLHPVHLHENDLLAVFYIAHIYGVPGLVSFLGDRIWDTLELTIETWPCLVRFSERFCLKDIKRRALRHASETRELWTVAVENLGLDDFKVFLRGIEQPDDRGKAPAVGGQGQKEDLRSLKDELLMMFLLVHYQDSSSSREPGTFPLHREDKSNSCSNNSGTHAEAAAMMRKLSRTNQHDSARIKIRQQLQRRPSMTSPPPLHAPPSSNCSNTTTNSTRATTTGPTQQTTSLTESVALGLVTASPSSPSSSLRRFSPHQQAQTTKVDKAKMWMIRFKRDCGWGGQVSLLD